MSMDTMDSAMYIELPALGDYAAAAARLMMPQGMCTGRAEAHRVQKSYREIHKSHAEIARRYAALASPPPACEWLMDNFYMIEREYRAVMPRLEHARMQRRASDGAIAAALCRNLLLSGCGEITEARFTAYFAGAQSVIVLRRAELCLVPAYLSAAVIEGVAAVCREMRYAADTEKYAKRLEALFTTLRLLAVVDMDKLINAADITDSILCLDPTGEYARMDDGTKQAYLARVEKLAAREGVEEHIYARRLIKRAQNERRHIGFYLFTEDRTRFAGAYIAANVLLTLTFTLALAFTVENAAAALLLLLPMSELVKSAVDFILLHLVHPRRVFRMDTRSGVPGEGRTICVISTLLGGEADAKRLEELYFACRGEGAALCFGLLADLPVADSAVTEDDEKKLSAAREAIAALNRKYGGRFYLFTRPRRYDGERYAPYERKRGAILELAKLLCDKPSELEVEGEKDALTGIKYILTLDSDTRIYPGVAGELIGAMLHPLCRPVIDKKRGVVTAGHALVHPRIDTELESACETDFARIFAGAGGCDPYGSLCGELYMDAFDSGGFAGKGVIDANALLACTGNFPVGRVLSHDAPEGAYLRGAYMGDVEFSDRFPSRPLGYYKRLHRWIRGDWQNLPFIFAPHLRDIDRWRLIDSLRRSLIAPATLAAICAGFFMAGAGLRVAAWAALMALLTGLFMSLAESGLARRGAHGHTRRYTRIFSGVGGAMVQCFIRLWLLPYEAWVSLTAIITALWRLCISHRRLLQWQTSAEVGGGRSVGAHMRAMYAPVILGAVLVALCPAVIGKSAGLMWLVSPLAAFALSLGTERDNELASNEKAYLMNAAKRSFAYFEGFFSPEDSFLPPDNYQEQPPVGTARRTSPTNIGLALCAHTAAVDMGIITRAECAEYTRCVLDTLERMPRHMGHFYNWYDTATLLPLLPAYISTVDSGNMYAGLLTTRQAMEEYGEGELAARITALIAPMNFAPLYDEVRGLFHICYDTENERGAGGWYDLMASEAMLTSYVAVAKGDVPVRHWRRLSRALLQKDGYRGLASWTGTMFEYLMPELFLPVFRGSLLYESVHFCLYAQKRRIWAGKPWGISESAFYSLDSALNYRYKAHGCPALALKRGQDEDMVVSPYSSFLALAVDPEGGVRNLRHLEALGAVGRWGFIEALDFTPRRCRSDSGEQVRCYMAHHIGMSVIAAANAVCDNCVQRRFMSSPEMSAFSLLLQERADSGGVMIRRDTAQAPERAERTALMRWQLRGGEEDNARQVCALSNGAYNILASNAMETRAQCGKYTIYDAAAGLGCDGGMEIWAQTDEWEQRLAPCERPLLWELEEDVARISGEMPNAEYTVSVSTAYGDCGEGRSVTVCSDVDMPLVLRLHFKPLLAPITDYAGHPAFWALGVHVEEQSGMLLCRRVRRGDVGELWLCLASNAPLSFSLNGGTALGWLNGGEICARAALALNADTAQTVRFALCVSHSRDECMQGAQRILVSGINDRGNMVSAGAAHLRMSGEEVGAAMGMLDKLWPERVSNACAKRALWPHGISGERPIICCDGRAVECEALLKRFCLLKSCGVNMELVYLTDEQGEYQQPIYRKVAQTLSAFSLESLIGAAGGVHFAPMSAAGDVISRAAVTVGKKSAVPPALPWIDRGKARVRGTVPAHEWHGAAFSFTVKDTLPARVWQHIMSNGSTGYIAADGGTGYMWYKNAREMRITAPNADINDTIGAEALWVDADGERVSLFAANDGRECTVTYAPGEAHWIKRIGTREVHLTAFIDMDADARIFVIEGAAGMELHWGIKPNMSGGDSKAARVRSVGDALVCENPEAYIENAQFAMLGSLPCELQSGFYPETMLAALVCDSVTVLVCGCAPVDELRALCAPEAAHAALNAVRVHWQGLLGRFHITSDCAALDDYLNTWAVYQCVACRLDGRASLYQSGGAIGFRDQLQDAGNLLLISPEYARERILDCCKHQYTQGDVMHWWHCHNDGDRGVRTRCSDDLLWLVWALCEYVEKTGDTAICHERVGYITSDVLSDAERDRYETPSRADEEGDVLNHVQRALDECISRGFGAHGLPYIGSGDWNDALDNVHGESVWLAWFLSACAARFAALPDEAGRGDSAHYRRIAEKVAAAANSAWTGRWYARAYYTDGTPLGGEDRVDSIAQSWAVLSGTASDADRAATAVDAALRTLVDKENKLVKLFAPPYTADDAAYPGYIVSYGEGFRENGGQYTHGAIWLAMAAMQLSRCDEAWDIFSMLLPAGHDLTRYGAEPFVLAADVYSAAGREGEAGWSWYTGAAGWYFRAVTEEVLGMRLKGGKLTLSPRLPQTLGRVSVNWTDYGGVVHRIDISHGGITVDGTAYHGQEIG